MNTCTFETGNDLISTQLALNCDDNILDQPTAD